MNVAAARKGLEIIQREPQRAARVRQLAQRLATKLREAGFHVPATESAVVPVIFSDEDTTLRFVARCREHGLFVIPIFFPAVPINAPRVRLTAMASHTDHDIEHAVTILTLAAHETGLH